MFFLPTFPFYRGTAIDSSWLSLDGAGPSSGVRSGGLGRVQMMMRQLAAVGETYAQTTLEDAAWSLWPVNPSQPGTSGSPIPPGSVRYPVSAGGLHMRATSRAANDSMANILAMAETVREVLPHIPDELIIEVCVLCIFLFLFFYFFPCALVVSMV